MSDHTPRTYPGPAYPGAPERSQHVFDGEPDARQSLDPATVTSRFRPTYRPLTVLEKELHDAIKVEAALLEKLFEQVPDGREKSIAFTKLEESIMWAIKALTK